MYVPFINGEIFAIDNQSGAVFWKSRLGNIKDQIVLRNQVPVINDGKLFIQLDSAPLRNELLMAKNKIIELINKEVGEKIIQDVVFL